MKYAPTDDPPSPISQPPAFLSPHKTAYLSDKWLPSYPH